MWPLFLEALKNGILGHGLIIHGGIKSMVGLDGLREISSQTNSMILVGPTTV